MKRAKIDEVGRDDTWFSKLMGLVLPTKLTSPKRLLSVIMALFFGFFTSIFIIYFKEQGNKLFVVNYLRMVNKLWMNHEKYSMIRFFIFSKFIPGVISLAFYIS